MIFHTILKALVIIGGLNWGVIAVGSLLNLRFSISEWFFFEVLQVHRIIANSTIYVIVDWFYVLIGLSAAALVVTRVVAMIRKDKS